jgi:aspartate carbamoyltransferase catalytic subunit
VSPVLAETHAVPSPIPPGSPEPGPARRDLLDLETLPKADLVRLLEGAAAFRRVLATPSRRKAVLTGTAWRTSSSSRRRARACRSSGRRSASAPTACRSSRPGSSVAKGESLLDTVWTLESMGVDLVVVRHESAGVPLFLARRVSAHVINAGDGCHEHPTQGLLDAGRCSTTRARSPA